MGIMVAHITRFIDKMVKNIKNLSFFRPTQGPTLTSEGTPTGLSHTSQFKTERYWLLTHPSYRTILLRT